MQAPTRASAFEYSDMSPHLENPLDASLACIYIRTHCIMHLVHPPRSARDVDAIWISTAIAGGRTSSLKLQTATTTEVQLSTSSPVVILPKAPSPWGTHPGGIESSR
jgi:hypothetical protein